MADPHATEERIRAMRVRGIRGVIEQAARDAELLDGRRFDDAPFESAFSALDMLLADLAAALAREEALREALTEAWEYLAHDESDAAAVVIETALASVGEPATTELIRTDSGAAGMADQSPANCDLCDE